MALADNIVKYRNNNHLSQEQLAEALSISRQSISKWETGENLPSIDNLISLSGLLDISLDELITGEPYLHFPFNYGKPKNRWPVVFLVAMIILGGLIFSGFHRFYVPFLGAFAAYMMAILFYPFDFKRYYTYWTLEKTGITYVANDKDVYNSLDEVLIPIKTLFHARKTEFISYQDMQKVEVKLDLLKVNPNATITTHGGYASSRGQYMNEGFHLIITTKTNQVVYLDLRQYYWPKSKERQMLSTIISFMKRKNIEFIDKQNIAEMVK
ncbi:helix-turn-helix domain-containing protein, partial [Companilactobacillus huachuanensis]